MTSQTALCKLADYISNRCKDLFKQKKCFGVRYTLNISGTLNGQPPKAKEKERKYIAKWA